MKKCMYHFGSAIFATLISTTLSAQTDTSATLKQKYLSEVIVSASRLNAGKKELPQSIVVIGKDDIALTGANDLTDVLKKRAGIDVIQYPGMLSGVGMRGYRPQFSGLNQRTLLLIDGRPSGATNLAMIDLNNVERIEIIKGAASSLYGSQAMGGVVNVVTKKSSGEIHSALFASYGSFDVFQAGVSAGGAIDKKLDFDVSLKHFQQNTNYRLGNDNLFRDKFGWDEADLSYYNFNKTTYTYEVDSAGTINDVYGDGEIRQYTKYQYQTGDLRFGYKINEKWRIDLNGSFFSASNVQNPGDYFYGTGSQSLKNPYRYGSGLTVQGKIRKNHALTFTGYNSIEFSDYRMVNDGVVSDYVTSKRTNKWIGFQMQDVYTIGRHTLTFGIDQNNSATSSRSFKSNDGTEKAPYSPNYDINSSAVFTQGYFKLLDDKLHTTIGARVDNVTFEVQETPFLETARTGKENYGVFNPSLGFKYFLPFNLNAHVSAGRAFVTPDAYNVAGYSISGPGQDPDVTGMVNVTSGNPELKPENGITFDGGFGYYNRKNGLEIDLTYFNTTVSNRITMSQTEQLTEVELTEEGDTIASKTTYINAENAVMNGVEAMLSWDLGAFADNEYSFRFFVGGTKYFTLKEEFIAGYNADEAAVYAVKNVQNVADLTVNYGVEYSKAKFRTRLSGRYVGERYDIDWTDYIKKPEIKYNPFMLLDFAVGFELRKDMDLLIQLNNITDENYYEKRGFNMPGRNINVKLNYIF